MRYRRRYTMEDKKSMFKAPDDTLAFHNKGIADIAMGQRCRNKAKSSAYILTSPLGHVYTNACPDGLHCVRLYGDADYDNINWDVKVDFIRASSLMGSNPHAKQLKKWLQAYFDNAPRCEQIELELCCLDLYGDFNSKIWVTLKDHCPPGQLISYSELALKAGMSAGASKVVGYAINKNPFSLVVGDHRVVKASGEIMTCDDSQRNKLRRLLVDHEISFTSGDVEAELAKVRERCKATSSSRKRTTSPASRKSKASKSKRPASKKGSKKRKKKDETSSDEDEQSSDDSDS